MPDKGYVYILSNPSMPGLVKIGKTTRTVEARANELNSSGVPTPFDIEGEFLSPDCNQLELQIHEYFNQSRISECREFFRVEAGEAGRIIKIHVDEQVGELLEEYESGYILSNELCCVEELDILRLSNEVNRETYDVACAIEMLTPEEIAPALERYDIMKKDMLLARKDRKAELDIAEPEGELLQ